jgi:hypothetical protein
MSKDRYSDDHTIEILQDNDFTVITGGDIISSSTAGNIASSATGDISCTSTGGKVILKAEGSGKDIELNVENEVGSTGRVFLSGRLKIVTETPDPDGIGSGEDGVPLIIRHNAPLADQHMLRVVNNGTTKFFVDEDGGVDCGDITCNNLTYTSIGGGAANDIIDWSDVSPPYDTHINFTTTDNGNINLISNNYITIQTVGGYGSNINIDSDGEANIYATSTLILESATMVDIDAPLVSIDATSSISATVGGSSIYISSSGDITSNVADDLFIIKGNHTTDNTSHACLMMNTDTSDQSDVLKLLIGRTSDLETTNCFVRFSNGATTSGRTDGNQCGRIRGTGATTAVAYTSGTSDFGEWFEVGDPLEWVDAEELEEKIKANNFYFGIEEGVIVYVRARKLYKTSPGIPMAVTYRACVVGNELEENEKNENWFGQILSFVGQLPVKLQGTASSGDYLVDSGSGYCTAVSEEDITFNQYIKAIGRALEDSEEGLDHIWCAINYK